MYVVNISLYMVCVGLCWYKKWNA